MLLMLEPMTPDIVSIGGVTELDLYSLFPL